MEKMEKQVFKLDDGVSVIIKNGLIDVIGLESSYDYNLTPAQIIWRMYCNYRQNDKVVRSGFGLCGIYPFDPEKPTLTNCVENDTIHSTTCEELASLMFRYFPSMVVDPKEQKRLIQLLRYHDLGENVDRPDDGSTSKDAKFKYELNVFRKKISSLLVEEQRNLIYDFVMFEHADWDCWNMHDKYLMQIAKLCDKADALLGAFWYERCGRAGDLEYKRKHFGGITEQDEYFCKETGSTLIADAWTANFIKSYKTYDKFPLFLSVITTACRETRGKNFPWIESFLKKHGFNNNFIGMYSK